MTESSAEDSEVWFEAWKKAEEVAMHFNDLMMNFRLKAIAGVTAATGVFGTILLTKGEVATTAQNFRLFAAVAWLLLPVWAAVGYIDFRYYQPLLRGAVKEACRLEEESGGQVKLSTIIEETATALWGERKANFSRRAFYLLPALALAVAAQVAWGAASRQPTVPAGANSGSTTRGAEDWQRMKDCAAQAERLVIEHKAIHREGDPATSIMDWDNHYSPKYRRCYVREDLYSKRPAPEKNNLPVFTHEVYDAFEQRLLAMCTEQTTVKAAKAFCRVLQEETSEGDCLACPRYIDEHMNN